MKTVQKKGNTVESVLEDFKKENNLSNRDFSYEVIQESAKGFLGIFGNKQAVVKFTIQDSDEMIESFITELFEKMGIEVPRMEISKEDESYYIRLFPTTDIGLMVGKDGRFIDQLQYLLNRIFEENKMVGKILLDVDNYKERQKEQFRHRTAKQIAVFQAQNRKFITMFNLDAGSRRIVHREVEKLTGLSTLTIGDGKLKNVVIFNKEQATEADFKHMTFTPRDRRPSPRDRDSRPVRSNSRQRTDSRGSRDTQDTRESRPTGDSRPRRDNNQDGRADRRPNNRPPRPRRNYNNDGNKKTDSD
ncbi:MAG: Jag N-terminal domain-containing protein [Candidatus Cloacimonetes bacterium]|nr:Jag N-terminal domain-containing protein [Candidatus Cloacimonadota bacterium]